MMAKPAKPSHSHGSTQCNTHSLGSHIVIHEPAPPGPAPLPLAPAAPLPLQQQQLQQGKAAVTTTVRAAALTLAVSTAPAPPSTKAATPTSPSDAMARSSPSGTPRGKATLVAVEVAACSSPALLASAGWTSAMSHGRAVQVALECTGMPGTARQSHWLCTSACASLHTKRARADADHSAHLAVPMHAHLLCCVSGHRLQTRHLPPRPFS